jgi:hypothetical protein
MIFFFLQRGAVLLDSGEETSGKLQVAHDDNPLNKQLIPRGLKQTLDRLQTSSSR